MLCRNNYARANRLLSEIILKNALLDKLHYVSAKISNHRQIHASIHKSERVACCNNAVEYWQLFKSSANNLDFWMRSKLLAQYIAKSLSSIYKYELHSYSYFAPASFVENNSLCAFVTWW